ncbi:hypothetical protein LOZ58_001728 [Ophidiomyces ophidiicola]|nr:hypothetical protein LOZ58_001728 [Ophidiomyces ophidiicola]
MGFLKRMRQKVRGSGKAKKDAPTDVYQQEFQLQYRLNRQTQDYTKNLPLKVFYNIFTYVCPHSADDSLTPLEESIAGDGCMLCDMRNLAQCALVCRKWYGVAQDLLYRHVRIDAVHYCELEVVLAAKRKKSSWLNSNALPLDAPRTRFLLFMRTVRESKDLGQQVLSLRMPYMTRESSKSELARTVSILPNLRYVDLPAGFFTDDASCLTLKLELMTSCSDLRRMKYAHGSEASFAKIPQKQPWANVEVLELSKLCLEPNLLRLALSHFPHLQDLKLNDLGWLDNSISAIPASSPGLPPLQRLTLQDTPQVTAKGLVTYLSFPRNRDALKHLSLVNTGICPQELHEILEHATSLETLSITHKVTSPFPSGNIPPLRSKSLRLLHYEITSEAYAYGVPSVSSSYYAYLRSSLLTGKLTALKELYVRDANFSETLMASAPPKQLGGGENALKPSGPGLNQILSVYSKGVDETEWNFSTYERFSGSERRTSMLRPMSCHGAQLGPTWSGNARESVLMTNGCGGFLAVPSEERPIIHSGEWPNAGAKRDLWR